MENNTKPLSICLAFVGLFFLFGYFSLSKFWPTGFRWTPANIEYEYLMLVTFAVLGLFLLFAARNPLKFLPLIWFTVFACLINGIAMLSMAINDHIEIGHFFGDIPLLILIGIVLAYLTPKRLTQK